MEYGTLLKFIKLDVGTNKTFYVSGYYNPSGKTTAKVNIKPTKVTMHYNDPKNRHFIGVYAYDKQCTYMVARNEKGVAMSVNENVFVFDSEQEAVQWYNMQIENTAIVIEKRAQKLRENIIDGY